MPTKTWAAAFLDPALNRLKQADYITLCTAEPTTFNEAFDTYKKAAAQLTSGDFSGPVDGYVSGRRLTVAEKPGVYIGTFGGGTVRFFALVNSASLELIYVGRLPAERVLVGGANITIGSVVIELKDPF